MKTRGVLILAAVLAASATALAGEAVTDAPRRVSVIVTNAEARTFEAGTAVSGEVEAKTTAYVSARVEGTLEEIYVDEGDVVVAAETKLFLVDRANLERAVEIAREQVSVAECAVREREAALEQVRADYNKAKIDYDRFKRLYEEDHAVTKNAFEAQEARFLQLSAAVKHGEVLVELAGKQHSQARTALAISEKDMADAVVSAPVSGLVSRRYLEPGESVKRGQSVLRIEDPNVIEVSAFLPDEYYGRVEKGKTTVSLKVGGKDLGTQVVSYKSPTVSRDLRTFEIKCVIAGPPEEAAPGRIATMNVIFARREGVGVPVDGVVERAGGSVVFTVDGGTARMKSVTTGLVTDGWVEVVEGEIKPGDAVVTLGQESLDDGNAVEVVGGGRQ